MASTPPPQRKTYGDDPSQFVDLYMADDHIAEHARGTVLSIHGGYWRQKYGLDLNVPIAEHLATQGWTVANIEYRRVQPNGDGAWHEMSADVLDAIALIEDQPGPLVALGHSAGGQLALWAAAQAETTIDAVVALAPVSDLFLADGLELSDHATKELFGTSAAERPDLYAIASPLYLLPLGIPQLIVHGQKDEDVPFDMATEYTETAEAAGDRVELIDPKSVDHFNVIDPTHEVWRKIDLWLDGVRNA